VPRKKVKRRRPTQVQPSVTVPADDRTTEIYRLMGQAEELYRRKRYHQAITVCQWLAELDPSNMMPEQMVDGCRREILKRRAILISLILGVAIAAVGTVVAYYYLAAIRVQPAPGTLPLHERQTQAFLFRCPLRLQTRLEYTWKLLDEEGRPVSDDERLTLRPAEGKPWGAYYTPPYTLVRAASGGRPVPRRIVASGLGAAGREHVHAEWTIEVLDAPSPPTIFTVEPRPEVLMAIVAGTGERTFHVEATDGDSGTDLTYEWTVDKEVVQKGIVPRWTYRPPADALPEGKTGRGDYWAPPETIKCTVSNRFGGPLPVSVEWQVTLVRSNAPPQLIAFEPPLSDIFRINEGEERKITAKIYDPDEGDTRTATYNWELDGRTISRSSWCYLKFDPGTIDSEKQLTLKLTVADICGASVARDWQVVVKALPKPAGPGPAAP